MTHPNGTIGETRLVNYAKEHGFGGADRLTKTGEHDRGDVSLCPGVMAEVKHVKVAGRHGPATELLAGWMSQTRIEQANGDWSVSFLVVKREGTNDVGRWFAYIDAAGLARLVVDPEEDQEPHLKSIALRMPVCLPVANMLELLRANGWGDPL